MSEPQNSNIPDNIVEMMTQFNILVPAQIKRDMKAIAASRGVKMEIVVREAFEQFLLRDENARLAQWKSTSFTRHASVEFSACQNVVSLVESSESQLVASAGGAIISEVKDNHAHHMVSVCPERPGNIIKLNPNGTNALDKAGRSLRQTKKAA